MSMCVCVNSLITRSNRNEVKKNTVMITITIIIIITNKDNAEFNAYNIYIMMCVVYIYAFVLHVWFYLGYWWLYHYLYRRRRNCNWGAKRTCIHTHREMHARTNKPKANTYYNNKILLSFLWQTESLNLMRWIIFHWISYRSFENLRTAKVGSKNVAPFIHCHLGSKIIKLSLL